MASRNEVLVPEAVVHRAARWLNTLAEQQPGTRKKDTQEYRDAQCLFRVLREAKQARRRPVAQSAVEEGEPSPDPYTRRRPQDDEAFDGMDQD